MRRINGQRKKLGRTDSSTTTVFKVAVKRTGEGMGREKEMRDKRAGEGCTTQYSMDEAPMLTHVVKLL